MTALADISQHISLEAVRKELEKRDFDRWLPVVSPTPWNWEWAHLVHIRKALHRITTGESHKLLISCPPQHGKSQQVTVRYPAWRIEGNPLLRTAVACYDQKHAKKFSRQIRKIVRSRGVLLSKERQAVEEWETLAGGYLKAVGVGSGIAGNPVDLLMVDDPIRGHEEAASEAYRERVWWWYAEDICTRLQKFASIVIIATRWHQDDLIGRILNSEDAPNWEVINLPAEAEENDPLGREIGEPLCPDRFDKKQLEEKRMTLQAGYWALYQGRPVPRGGATFKTNWFRKVSGPPADAVERVRFWDCASTLKGDWTVGVLMSRTKGGAYCIENIVRGRWEPAERDQVILRTAQADGQNVKIFVEEEPGSAGKSVTVSFVKLLAGFVVAGEKATGDKEVRAAPLAAQFNGGNITIVEAPWNTTYINEMCVFPSGKWDDQVDASSGAFNKLAQPGSIYLTRGLLVVEDGRKKVGGPQQIQSIIDGSPAWVNPSSDDWLVDD